MKGAEFVSLMFHFNCVHGKFNCGFSYFTVFTAISEMPYEGFAHWFMEVLSFICPRNQG